MATLLHEGLEKAAYTPVVLTALTDALYERLRGQMKRKKDIVLLDVLVLVFCYRVQVAQGRGRVSHTMNTALHEVANI